MARLLITGGAGFIGSHTCVVLLEAGHELVVLDNFDNSSPEALQRVAELGGGPVHILKGTSAMKSSSTSSLRRQKQAHNLLMR